MKYCYNSFIAMTILLAGCNSIAPNRAEEEFASPILQAIEIAEYGRKYQDASKLRQAAIMMSAIGARPATSTEDDLSVVWQKEAQRMSDTEEHMKTVPSRGRVVGPAYRKGVLKAEGQETFKETFYATQEAEVLLRLNDAVDMNISISSDESEGKVVCSHKHINKVVACRWYPVWTGPYSIRISNPGSSEVQYYLITN